MAPAPDDDDPARAIGPSYRNAGPNARGLDDVSRGLARPARTQGPRVAQATPKPRPAKAVQPRLTIIGVDSGLTDKQRGAIARVAATALEVTTDDASDPGVKAGVVVTFTEGLKGSEAQRKRGDIIVYVVAGIAKDEKRARVVRDILKERAWDKDPRNRTKNSDRLYDDVSRLSGWLRDVNLHDPGTGVVVVDITNIPASPSDANLTAVAGTIIHEGIGHQAGLTDVKARGIMSDKTPMEASLKDIEFDKQDHDKVNQYLELRAKDPTWDYK